MDSPIGSVFRGARNRRKIDLSEVEAATRIRFRYLRAIENEEWDVLPGGVYTRGFIRTYASFLGLDGDRLVRDYRESVEPWHRSAEAPPSQPGADGSSSGPRGTAFVALTVIAVVAVAVIAIVAIPGGGGESGSNHHRRGLARKPQSEVKPPPAPGRA